MHGHGDRPHLCYYPGCERGILGNGFPRRYNLFDHMKRVHDHRDEQATPSQLHEPGSRQTGSRKRKASSPVVSEVSVPARKVVRLQQPSPPLSLPPGGSIQAPTAFPELANSQQNEHRQGIIYAQWANQRELLEFQINMVHGPGDEANLSRTSQNIGESRRVKRS